MNYLQILIEIAEREHPGYTYTVIKEEAPCRSVDQSVLASDAPTATSPVAAKVV